MATAKAQPKAAAPAEVDLTRKTPWGTEYRVARTATAGVKCDQTWVTICLEHTTVHGSATLRTACTAGTRGSVADWCAPCAKLHNAAVKAAAARKAAIKD